MKHIPRIFLRDKIGRNINCNEFIILDSFDSNHIANVLRMKVHDHVHIFNNIEEWDTEIVSLNSKTVTLSPISVLRNVKPSSHNIHLFFSIFKKQDLLIEKATEIGVTHIHPIVTEYSNINHFKKEKYLSIVKQALEQSGRISDVHFSELTEFENIAKVSSFPILACIERAHFPSIIRAYKNILIQRDVGILIGPEGGFSQQEQQIIRENNSFIPVSLGDNILRAETAGICALNLIKTLLDHEVKL